MATTAHRLDRRISRLLRQAELRVSRRGSKAESYGDSQARASAESDRQTPSRVWATRRLPNGRCESARRSFSFPMSPPIRMSRSPYPDRPVLLCVEILSPEDRAGETFKKCELYHAWGVPYCWVIDPVDEIGWEYHRGGSVEQCTGALNAGAIQIPLSAVF